MGVTVEFFRLFFLSSNNYIFGIYVQLKSAII